MKSAWNQLLFLVIILGNWGEVYSLGQRDVHNRHINDHSHSCIRDQCWKSFPSPFFLPQHMSPKVGVEPKALSDLANKARPPSCFVSTPAPRRQPQVAAGRVGSVEEVMEVAWVCSFARLSYKMSSQLSENIWWNIIYIHFCIDTDLFFLAQDLYVQTLRFTSAPPVVAF